jgi:hypothetical protein
VVTAEACGRGQEVSDQCSKAVDGCCMEYADDEQIGLPVSGLQG